MRAPKKFGARFFIPMMGGGDDKESGHAGLTLGHPAITTNA